LEFIQRQRLKEEIKEKKELKEHLIGMGRMDVKKVKPVIFPNPEGSDGESEETDDVSSEMTTDSLRLKKPVLNNNIILYEEVEDEFEERDSDHEESSHRDSEGSDRRSSERSSEKRSSERSSEKRSSEKRSSNKRSSERSSEKRSSEKKSSKKITDSEEESP